ncbi:MAG: MFS transporter, partial [Ancrocorticia sp.]
VIAFGVLGIGVGAAETISNDLILGAVPAHKAGAASAISETAYETGAVLGTAVLGSILNAAYRSHVTIPESLTAAQANTAKETLGGATKLAEGLDTGTANTLLESAHSAFDSGVLITSSIGVVFMLIASFIALRTLRTARA